MTMILKVNERLKIKAKQKIIIHSIIVIFTWRQTLHSRPVLLKKSHLVNLLQLLTTKKNVGFYRNNYKRFSYRICVKNKRNYQIMLLDISKNLNETLDRMKVLLMLLVVFGHVLVMYTNRGLFEIPHDSDIWKYIADFIYAFHMPVFISISGTIYAICKSKGKYRKNKEFISNKFSRLLIPYLFFSILMFGTLCYIGKFPSNHIFGHFIYAFVFGVNCRHLWYLYTLFGIFFLYNSCYSFIVKYQAAFTFVFAALYFISYKLPLEFQIHNIAYNVIYFHIGVIIYTIILAKFDKVAVNPMIYWSIIFLTATLIFFMSWADADVFIKRSMSLLSGIAGIPLIYGICMFRVLPPLIIKYLASNSFGLYLFHPIYNYLLVYYLKDSNIPPYILIPTLIVAITLLSFMSVRILRAISFQHILGEANNNLPILNKFNLSGTRFRK